MAENRYSIRCTSLSINIDKVNLGRENITIEELISHLDNFHPLNKVSIWGENDNNFALINIRVRDARARLVGKNM